MSRVCDAYNDPRYHAQKRAEHDKLTKRLGKDRNMQSKPLVITIIVCMIALTLSTIIWMWDVKHETMEAIERGVQKASENKMQEQIDKIEMFIDSFSRARTSEKLTQGLDLWNKLKEKPKDED